MNNCGEPFQPKSETELILVPYLQICFSVQFIKALPLKKSKFGGKEAVVLVG
jgi:hypothetical protein